MADMSAFPRFVYSCLNKVLVELTAIETRFTIFFIKIDCAILVEKVSTSYHVENRLKLWLAANLLAAMLVVRTKKRCLKGD